MLVANKKRLNYINNGEVSDNLVQRNDSSSEISSNALDASTPNKNATSPRTTGAPANKRKKATVKWASFKL